MTTSSPYLIKAQYREECTCPALGELLMDYVVDLLKDSAAAEVEEHLLDCLHCRETYLKMLSLEGPCRRPEATPDTGAAPPQIAVPATGASNVINMGNFKRRRL